MTSYIPSLRLLLKDRKDERNYEVVDRKEANLFRNIYPYDKIPKIDFDFNEPAIKPAEELLITDTTFRDGQQARPPYSVEQMVEIYKILSKLSGSKGIIRKTEFFLYSKKDKQALDACRNLGLEFPQITSWIRAVADDLKLVKEMNIAETGILTSVSDYHIFLKLGLNRQQAMDKYLTLIKSALDLGIVPRCHFEDITRADLYGFVIPFAQKLKSLSEEANTKILIRLCDTMGMGISYPGAAIPRSVPKLVRAMIDEAGYSGADLEWHGHNDFYKGFINATTAWLYGLGSINGSLLGFGERTGNTPIEGLIVEYAALRGTTAGMDLTAINEMAQYFTKELNFKIPPNQPLVGRDFNVTSAGIHADGLMKNEEIYNIFDTKKILNRPFAISINDKSGTAGIAHWLNQRLDLPNNGDKAIDKKHPGIVKMHKSINNQYDEEGRSTNISNREMEKLARHYLPQFFLSHFDKLKTKAKELAHSLIAKKIEHPSIRSMDPSIQEAIMEQWVTEVPFFQFMYVTDNRGVKITKNIAALSEKAKYAGQQDVGANLSDRIWFVKPMEDGKIHVTDFYTSRFTGALCITVSGPIRNDEDEIIGVLGLDIKFEDLAKLEVDDYTGDE